MPSRGSRSFLAHVPVALPPAAALIAGVTAGTYAPVEPSWPLWTLPPLGAAAALAWHRARPPVTFLLLLCGFFTAATTLAADARAEALRPTLRILLDERIGGFDIETVGPETDHDPILTVARLTEDAAVGDGFVSIRGNVTGIVLDGDLQPAAGGVNVSVSGSLAAGRAPEWTAGRVVRMHATFRRPARYLNDGVPDLERALALDGTTLFASVKSGLLIDVISTGTIVEEAAASVRAHVRRSIASHVAAHDPVSAAIVTAVLIGDRTGLPPDIRDRLQAAGTYHVIAISGGNIAILGTAALLMMALAGIRGRLAACLAAGVLLAYAQIVTAGPSVWRATLMALMYFTARALDHGSTPWHVMGAAAGLMVVLHPLDARDPGFVLTFGATVALLEGGRRGSRMGRRWRWLSWLVASVVASLATELALLPVSAQTFSRVTSAGLVLNLAAVPLMTVVQIAGMVIVSCDRLDAVAAGAGLGAHAAAAALVGSARLVELAPWLAARVPPPGMTAVLTYYVALALMLWSRRLAVRVAGSLALAAAGLTIVSGVGLPGLAGLRGSDVGLRLTVFDVGQAEAMVLQLPGGESLLVDTGGTPFGGGAFDVGARVLAPALWARGIRRLDALLVTHGDPDHLGGARSVVQDFTPLAVWEGVRVPRHRPTQEMLTAAEERRIRVVSRRAGDTMLANRVLIRVLHPPEPDWERHQVRNDDSVVVEVVYGDVALLLTGDISASIEASLLPQLTPARVRILKVAHHGSRTSTSIALVDGWQPDIAVISAGRGNTFGHPAPEVVRRLESSGATILRTDRQGQITIETDGRHVEWKTYTGETASIGEKP